MAASTIGASTGGAVTIEIDDVASDRVERQRAFAEGALPLPGTPDLGQLKERLEAKGFKAGSAIFIRVFKAESELEVWMQKAGKYELLATYPICHWAGTIGPKVREGDKQNPEGFYSIGARQLHRIGRWPRSLNLGYPNSFDRAWGRTGSYILVHGGCSSVGCFAMTNAVMAEIFDLSERALRGGQPRVELHVFPFKMTDANLAAHAKNPWLDFWRNLKEGYDAFETTRLPPRVGLCDRRYVVEANRPGEVGAEGPLALCGALRAAQVEPNSQSFAQLPPDWPQPRLNPETTAPDPDSPLQRAAYSGQPLSPLPSLDEQSLLLPPRINLNRPRGGRFAAAPPLLVAPPCNLGLASCRKFLAMKSRTDGRQLAGGRGRISKAAGAQIAQAMGKLSAALKSDASQRRNVR